MAKSKKQYFAHDFGARNDPKMQHLLMEMGYEGVGLYWSVVELLYEQGGYLPLSMLRSLSFSLRVDEQTLKRLIEEFELFECDDEEFWSESALSRMGEMESQREKRSAAGRRGNELRWGESHDESQCDDNGIAMRQQPNRNATTMVSQEKNDVSLKINKKIKEINKEKKECVCENAHTHTPTHTHTQEDLERFESYRNWVSVYAPSILDFEESLSPEGFIWLYRKYGGDKLKKCAIDIHSKRAVEKNRNALNTFKNFISRIS